MNNSKKLAVFVSIALAQSVLNTAYAGASLQPIFEKLTNKQNWTWQTFNALPKASNDTGLKKDQNKANGYNLERTLTGYDNATITAYGTKTAPNEVVFYSGGWGSNNSKNLLKLSDIVNPASLKKVKSNCNFGKIEDRYTGKDDTGHRYQGMNYIDYQNIYQWSRPNSQTLYIVEQRGGGYVETGVANQGINSSVIVTPDIKSLSSAVIGHGWHKNKNGKLIACTFN